MNDFVTLYQPPGQPGETFFAEASKAQVSAAAYCTAGSRRIRADLEAFHLESGDDYKQWRSRALSWLKKEGGMLIEFNDREYVVRLYEAGSYRPPQRLWAARLESLSPQAVPIKGHTSQQRHPSDRLIVPVSQTAEGELESWMKQLKGFPEDLRAMVFHSLCRPGLEFRVSRLETAHRAAGPPSQASPSSAKRALPFFRRPSSWAILSSACSALLSLLVLAVFLGSGSGQGRDPVESPVQQAPLQGEGKDGQPASGPGHAEGTESKPVEKAGPEEDEGGEATASTFNQEIETNIKALMSAWSQADVSSSAGQIYASHFGGQSDEKFKRKNLNPEGWAIAKLHALCDGHKLGQETLRNADYRTPLKASLKRNPLKSEWNESFAYFGCTHFGVAGLPYVEEDTAKAKYVTGQCGNYDYEKILKSLQNLTDCVKNGAPPEGKE